MEHMHFLDYIKPFLLRKAEAPLVSIEKHKTLLERLGAGRLRTRHPVASLALARPVRRSRGKEKPMKLRIEIPWVL